MMSRMKDYAMCEQEQDMRENESGAFDQEFAEWVAAHEQDELNNTAQTESANRLPH